MSRAAFARLEAAMARRLARLYALCPEHLRADGRAWYAAARAFVRNLAAARGLDPRTVAAAVAVASPGVSWTEQTRRFEAFAAEALSGAPAPSFPGYRRNSTKAAAILVQGLAPGRMPTGPKVAAFAAALAGDDAAVVVDRHAVSAALARPIGGRGPTKIETDAARSAFRLAAEAAGETPCAFQAILWLYWRALAVALWPDRSPRPEHEHAEAFRTSGVSPP